ncbi:MAG TPA: diacylglycerol kinase family protein [Tepidisphaeraceae bacterium]|nr:diacylglycerol kinase family protein [Tepidisphaeraceae bacterium]
MNQPPKPRGLRRFFRSFGWAGRGAFVDFPRGQNARVQICIAIVALISAGLLRFDRIEWCILLLTIALVLSLEAVNSAIEGVVDLASPEQSELARRAKDIAAGAVLIAAIVALAIGFILFSPKLLALLR